MRFAELTEETKDGRKAHVRAEAAAGKPLGLLALVDDEPLGWLAVYYAAGRGARICTTTR